MQPPTPPRNLAGRAQRSTGSEHSRRSSYSRRPSKIRRRGQRRSARLTSSHGRWFARRSRIGSSPSASPRRRPVSPARPQSAIDVVYSVSSRRAVIVDCFSGELPVGVRPVYLRTKIKIECAVLQTRFSGPHISSRNDNTRRHLSLVSSPGGVSRENNESISEKTKTNRLILRSN